MPPPISAPEMLNREFLEIRCKILEVAAALDRLERAEGSLDADPRMAKLRAGLDALADGRGADRAEAVQMIFSLAYDEGWRDRFSLTKQVKQAP